MALVDDDGTGKPYLSPWIQLRETSAGDNKTHFPLSIGEQVALVSQSGDIKDAEISHSLPSDENPRPSDKFDELLLSQYGPFELRVSDGGKTVILKCGDSSIKMTENNMEIRSSDIDVIHS